MVKFQLKKQKKKKKKKDKSAQRKEKKATKTLAIVLGKNGFMQGYNARKVILEVCASFIPQCTVSGR